MLDHIEDRYLINTQEKPARPQWQVIYDDLHNEILSGLLEPGSKLPSEKQLCERFGVSRMTVRRALGDLQRDSLLTARKGAGVFVRRAPARYQITDGKRFIDGVEGEGSVSTRTLSIIREGASAAQAKPLRLRTGAGLIVVTRLRLINDEPVFLNSKRLPAIRFPDFETVYWERQSITDVYRHHGITEYHRTETRVTGGFASEEEAAILRTSPGTPLLRSQSLNQDDDDALVEHSVGAWLLTSVEFVFPGS